MPGADGQGPGFLLPHGFFHRTKIIPACTTIPRYILRSTHGVKLFLELFEVCPVVCGVDGTDYAVELPAEQVGHGWRGARPRCLVNPLSSFALLAVPNTHAFDAVGGQIN